MKTIQLSDSHVIIDDAALSRISALTPDTRDISNFLGHFFQFLCAEILEAKLLPNHEDKPDLMRVRDEGVVEFFEAKITDKRNGSMIKRNQLDGHVRDYPDCYYILGYYDIPMPARAYRESLAKSVRERIEQFFPHAVYVFPARDIRTWYTESPLVEKPKRGTSHDVVKNLRERDLRKSLLSKDVSGILLERGKK